MNCIMSYFGEKSYLTTFNDKSNKLQFHSVDVKADRKILTVVFPDGRDGRTFTLKVVLRASSISFWIFV